MGGISNQTSCLHLLFCSCGHTERQNTLPELPSERLSLVDSASSQIRCQHPVFLVLLCVHLMSVFSLHGQLSVSAVGTVGKLLYWIISPSLWGRSHFGLAWSLPELLVGCIGIGAPLEKWLLRWTDWMGLDHRVRWGWGT